MSGSDARIGKDGTVYTVDGDNYLGYFTDCVVRQKQTVVERHGPQDDYERIEPTRLGLEISGSSFVPSSGYAEIFRGLTPPSSTAVAVSCNLVDGGTVAASGYITSSEVAVGDGANTESFVFRATGTFTTS